MADPIFWCNAEVAKAARVMRAGHFDPMTGERVPSIDPLTRLPLMERIPQRAHDGDSDPKSPSYAAGMPRWMHVLRHDGHEVRVPVTTAAAPVEDSRYGIWMRMKARELGWIPIGQCPISLVLAGLIRRHHIVERAIVEDPPCPSGRYGERHACPHYLAEREARRVLRARVQHARDRATESNEQKSLKAQQATAEGILAVVKAMSDRGGPEPKPPPQEPKPAPEPPSEPPSEEPPSEEPTPPDPRPSRDPVRRK